MLKIWTVVAFKMESVAGSFQNLYVLFPTRWVSILDLRYRHNRSGQGSFKEKAKYDDFLRYLTSRCSRAKLLL